MKKGGNTRDFTLVLCIKGGGFLFARVSRGYLSKRVLVPKRNSDCFYENTLSLLHKRSGTKLERTSLSTDVCLRFSLETIGISFLLFELCFAQVSFLIPAFQKTSYGHF